MEETKKVLDLDQLRKMPIGLVSLQGEEHEVLQPVGRVIQSVRTADTNNSTERLYAAVAKSIPTLTEDQVSDLTINEVTAIWAVACGGIEAAKAMFPNVYRPETQ